jgi:hypothetical protein
LVVFVEVEEVGEVEVEVGEVEESVDGLGEAGEGDVEVEALLFVVVIDAELIDVNGGSFSGFL